MIACLPTKPRHATPVFEVGQLATESDVEQKLLLPFLTHSSYVGIPIAWVRTKEYMSPTAIDKAAGKRYGYIPDYSVWLSGLPLVIIEAKATDVAVEVGLREAQLYASEINKKYPPNVNPIGFVLACNGEHFALSEWDSQTSVLNFKCTDAAPGAAVLETLRNTIGKEALTRRLKALQAHFQSRPFVAVASNMGGQARLNEQLGVNEFAHALFPTLTKYFAGNTDETSDDIIDRAYVSTDEIGTYESVLETYLKDRTSQIGGSQVQPIVTSRHTATGISTEIQKFSNSPNFYSRVQLVVGSVGAGKSTFIRRYYRRLIGQAVANRTRWAFVNFNVMPPGALGEALKQWIGETFVESFTRENNFDIFELSNIELIFKPEIGQFERGPAKAQKQSDNTEYVRKRTALLESLTANRVKVSESITRHFSGERGLGVVVVFDNVDKRSRDQQLAIFEAAQWFKNITRALVIVNLRDSTFEAHRDEPPLDAFSNAINFYVRAPRFSQVIRKRLELVLEVLPDELAPQQEYTLASGYRIKYPSSKLGEFLLSIYLSLFDSRSLQIGSSLEALVAKDVRRALGMFGDILVSPHVLASQITGAALGGGQNRLPEFRIIRSLMRGRYRYFNGKSQYIRNVLGYADEVLRPSNFLFADILEFLIRNRKAKIDFTQEGYATIATVQKFMGKLGYDEEDVFRSVGRLAEWGMIETESLVVTELTPGEAVRVHASGFIHMRYLLTREEYLVGITTDMKFASRSVAEEIAAIWAGQTRPGEPSLASRKRIMKKLRDYIAFEYERRCRRHAFYGEEGYGGKTVLSALDRALDHLMSIQAGAPKRSSTRLL